MRMRLKSEVHNVRDVRTDDQLEISEGNFVCMKKLPLWGIHTP